jgi:NADPH-dependent 2,4-dienoyl-CoA reductase/sulfur reductase-like enzyme
MTQPEQGRGIDGPLARVVIVGAGLAGVTACARLRELGYSGRLTLLGAELELPYDRPPLSKDLLLRKQSSEDVRLRSESWYADNDIELRLGTQVTDILPDEGRVRLADGGTEPADAVLLATGGRPRALAVPGAEHPALHTLRTLGDGVSLRDRLVPGVRVGVVGAGLVGAEVAAGASTLGCDVTVVASAPRPLEHVVGAQVAEVLMAQHRSNGVRVLVGMVSGVFGQGPVARLCLRDSDRTVDCDVVVVGVGIDIDTRLAVGAGLTTDGGVLVDDAQRTSHPRIFAAGDVARSAGPAGPLPTSEHWEAAVHEANGAAAAMLGRPVPARRAPWFWSDRYGSHLDVVGGFHDAEDTVIRGALDGDSFTAFAVRDGRCVGAAAVNRPLDVKAARRLIERRVPVNTGQLADESVEPRSLVRG